MSLERIINVLMYIEMYFHDILTVEESQALNEAVEILKKIDEKTVPENDNR